LKPIVTCVLVRVPRQRATADFAVGGGDAARGAADA